MDLKYLNQYKNEVDHCVRCGGCQATCPTYTYSGDESMVARGRMALVQAVIEGRLGFTDGFEKSIDSCLDCKACTKSCASDVKVDEIIYAAKAEITAANGCNPLEKMLAKNVFIKSQNHPFIVRLLGLAKTLFYDPLPDFLPLPSPLKSLGKKRKLPSIGSAPLKNRKDLTKKISNPSGKVAFYVGCATNMVHQHIGEAMIKVLEHNNIEVTLVEDELCCGIPFLSKGDRETAGQLAMGNIEAFSSLDVDAILSCCATCSATLKDYHKWIDDERAEALSAKVMDIHYYLAHHTDYRKGLGKINEHITWHDPCHLSRGQGIMDEPREILRSIPGLDFTEMSKPCHCCGFGGEVSLNDYKMSMAIAGGKVASVKGSGANELVTGCPACIMHMEDAFNHFKHIIPVRHTVEYLAKAYAAGKEER